MSESWEARAIISALSYGPYESGLLRAGGAHTGCDDQEARSRGPLGPATRKGDREEAAMH